MMTRRGFSLIELLVSIALIALLVAMLLPSLRGVREVARQGVCLSNTRQLATAWTVYANDHRERVMPLAYWEAADIGGGGPVYWWGASGGVALEVDAQRGFIAPYLGATVARSSVFECPSQPWGTYVAQGGFSQPTSTYGYNGYYLSPSRTPGWGSQIAHRPWRRLFEVGRPSDLFVFADAMLGTNPLRNCALLDPPMLWDGSGWSVNEYPTTAFRHGAGRGRPGSTTTARADGSAHAVLARREWVLHWTGVFGGLGSVGFANDPHYVPDAGEW